MGCDVGLCGSRGGCGVGYMYAGWLGQDWGGGGQSLQLAAVGKGTCRYKRERDDCVTPASQPTPTPRVIACV